MYFLSFKEAAANKKLLDHNLKEKRVQLIRNQALAIAIQKGKRKVSSNRFVRNPDQRKLGQNETFVKDTKKQEFYYL